MMAVFSIRQSMIRILRTCWLSPCVGSLTLIIFYAAALSSYAHQTAVHSRDASDASAATHAVEQPFSFLTIVFNLILTFISPSSYRLCLSSAVLLFSSFLFFFFGYRRLHDNIMQWMCFSNIREETTNSNKRSSSPSAVAKLQKCSSSGCTGVSCVCSSKKTCPLVQSEKHHASEYSGLPNQHSSTLSWARTYSRCSDSTWAGHGRSSSYGSRSLHAGGSPLLSSQSPPRNVPHNQTPLLPSSCHNTNSVLRSTVTQSTFNDFRQQNNAPISQENVTLESQSSLGLTPTSWRHVALASPPKAPQLESSPSSSLWSLHLRGTHSDIEHPIEPLDTSHSSSSLPASRKDPSPSPQNPAISKGVSYDLASLLPSCPAATTESLFPDVRTSSKSACHGYSSPQVPSGTKTSYEHNALWSLNTHTENVSVYPSDDAAAQSVGSPNANEAQHISSALPLHPKQTPLNRDFNAPSHCLSDSETEVLTAFFKEHAAMLDNSPPQHTRRDTERPAMLHLNERRLFHDKTASSAPATELFVDHEFRKRVSEEHTIHSLLQQHNALEACSILADMIQRGECALDQSKWMTLLRRTVHHLFTDTKTLTNEYIYTGHDILTGIYKLLDYPRFYEPRETPMRFFVNEFVDDLCSYYGKRVATLSKNTKKLSDTVKTASVLCGLLRVLVACPFSTPSLRNAAAQQLVSYFVASRCQTATHDAVGMCKKERLMLLLGHVLQQTTSSGHSNVDNERQALEEIRTLLSENSKDLTSNSADWLSSPPCFSANQSSVPQNFNEDNLRCFDNKNTTAVETNTKESSTSSPLWRSAKGAPATCSVPLRSFTEPLFQHTTQESTAFEESNVVVASPPIRPEQDVFAPCSPETASTQLPSPIDLSRTGSTSHLDSFLATHNYEQLPPKGPSLVEHKDMCFSIIQDCLRTADLNTTVEVYNALEQRIAETSDAQPQTWMLEALENILEVFALHDNIHYATKIVQLLEHHQRTTSRVYELAVTICCHLGDRVQASDYIHRAISLFEKKGNQVGTTTLETSSKKIPDIHDTSYSKDMSASDVAPPVVESPPGIISQCSPSTSGNPTHSITRMLKYYAQCLLENGQPHDALDFLEQYKHYFQNLSTASVLFCKVLKTQPDVQVVRRILHTVLASTALNNRTERTEAQDRKEHIRKSEDHNVLALNIPVDDQLFAALVDACVRHKEEEMLFELVQKFRSVWCEALNPDLQTSGILIKALGARGRIDDCRWIFWHVTERQKLQPSEVTYGCVLDALVNNNRVAEAVALFENIKNKGKVRPNTIMYSTIAKGYAQDKQLDNALRIHEEMKALGISINTVTYNTLVDACARVGAMDKAAKLLEDMLVSGVEPDLITFSTIAKGYCVQGDVVRAMHLLDAMQERGIRPDGILYNSLLDGCVRALRPDLCEQLWQKMQESGIPPSNFTLTILIKMFGRAGKLQRAFAAVQELPKRYGFAINAHVYTCLMSACIANKEFSKALDVFHCMKKDRVPPDAKTYETALFGTLRSGQLDEALQIVRDAFCLDSPPSCSMVDHASRRSGGYGGNNQRRQGATRFAGIPGLNMDPRHMRNMWTAMRDAGKFGAAAMKTITDIQNAHGPQANRFLPQQQNSASQIDLRRRPGSSFHQFSGFSAPTRRGKQNPFYTASSVSNGTSNS